jgi:PilZ domain-containing protein
VNFRCSYPGCTNSAVSALEARDLCISHLISACYRKLDELDNLIQQKDFKTATPQSIRRYLAECTDQAVSQALKVQDLSNRERAQLLDILLSCGELLGKLRRSPRIVGFVPVRLCGSSITQPWVEETVTEVLSKHGAMLRCMRPFAQGGTLDLQRLDTGRKALARVVWQEKEECGLHKMAVEFLNHSNFWN